LERRGGLPGGASHYVSKVFAQWHNLNARIARTLAEQTVAVAAVPPDEHEWLAGAGASALPDSAAGR
jgi:hypothetical protein